MRHSPSVVKLCMCPVVMMIRLITERVSTFMTFACRTASRSACVDVQTSQMVMRRSL